MILRVCVDSTTYSTQLVDIWYEYPGEQVLEENKKRRRSEWFPALPATQGQPFRGRCLSEPHGPRVPPTTTCCFPPITQYFWVGEGIRVVSKALVLTQSIFIFILLLLLFISCGFVTSVTGYYSVQSSSSVLDSVAVDINSSTVRMPYFDHTD